MKLQKKSFVAEEGVNLAITAAVVACVYTLTMGVVWFNLMNHNPDGYVYPKDEFGLSETDEHGQSFLNWLSPWFTKLGLVALALFVLIVFIIYRSYRQKNLCADCAARGTRTMTKLVVDDGAGDEYLCADCQNVRVDTKLEAEARERGLAEGSFDCPGCKGRHGLTVQMVKTPVKVMGRFVNFDDCSRCKGRFIDADEQSLLDQEAAQREAAAYSRGKSDGSSSGTMTGIAIGAALS